MTILRPAPLPIRPNGIPADLRSLDRWALWSYEWSGTRWAKVPHPVSQRRRPASVSRLDDWTTFSNALRVYELDQRTGGDIAGVGFLLANDGISIIDIDGCFDPAVPPSLDALTPDARALVERLGSFTEVSPSGTGLHVIVRARLPGPGRRRNGIEIYDRSRFFCLTGHILPGCRSTIESRQAEADALYRELAPVVSSSPRTGGEPALTSGATGLTDDEIIRLASRGGSLGDRFELFFVFGEWQPFFRSQSEADLWLIGRIAYFAGADVRTIARLFRRSALATRAKADRDAYLFRTIERAIAGRTRFFDPHRTP